MKLNGVWMIMLRDVASQSRHRLVMLQPAQHTYPRISGGIEASDGLILKKSMTKSRSCGAKGAGMMVIGKEH